MGLEHSDIMSIGWLFNNLEGGPSISQALANPDPSSGMTRDDIRRVYRNLQRHEHLGDLTFPSGKLLVADPTEMGYPEDLVELIGSFSYAMNLEPFRLGGLEKLARFPHGFLFLPGADSSYIVSTRS